MINIREYFKIIIDKLPENGNEKQYEKINLLYNVLSYPDKLTEIIRQEDIVEDPITGDFPSNYVKKFRFALKILVQYFPQYLLLYKDMPYDIFNVSQIVVDLALYNPKYISDYEELINETNWSTEEYIWNNIFQMLAESNPVYIQKYEHMFNLVGIFDRIAIAKLLATYHPEYLFKYKDLLWFDCTIAYYLAYYNPQYIGEFMDKKNNPRLKDYRDKCFFWEEIGRALSKRYPKYLMKYKPQLDKYNDNWEDIILRLILNHPEYVKEFKDKNIDYRYVKNQLLEYKKDIAILNKYWSP